MTTVLLRTCASVLAILGVAVALGGREPCDFDDEGLFCLARVHPHLDVRAFVFRCTNAACSSGVSLGATTLGAARLRHRERILVEWDPLGDRFLFQFNDNPQTEIPYAGTVPDLEPPGIDSKFIDIGNQAANCPTGPRPFAYMQAFVDNVFIKPAP